MFSPPPAQAGRAAGLRAAGGLPTPRPVRRRAPAAGGARVGRAAAAPVAAEQITITTDVVKATLSSAGGTLTRLELLKQPEQVQQDVVRAAARAVRRSADASRTARNVVLFDQSRERLYVAADRA